jgi:hypothetical protein
MKQTLAYNPKGWDVLPYNERTTPVIGTNTAGPQNQMITTGKRSDLPKSQISAPKKNIVSQIPLVVLGPKLNVLQIFNAFIYGNAFASDLFHYLRRFVTHTHLLPSYFERKKVVRYL